MTKITEIDVPVEEIEARRERVEAARRFEEPDRVPVIPALAHRFLIPQVGTEFRDYYADPETMLRTQILAQKWLLEIFLNDLRIHEFQGFGYKVDLDHIASVMGGKVVLLGNVNPMLIHSGTPAQVREATRRVIEALAPKKGFIVQDGNNIPPGSPLANISAMMEAAEIYGRYRL
jgi:uroporphyrinogen-III decarboxylase